MSKFRLGKGRFEQLPVDYQTSNVACVIITRVCNKKFKNEDDITCTGMSVLRTTVSDTPAQQ
jgi:hypothetical protein